MAEEQITQVERFVQLFARHQRGIHAYIWSLVPNRADSDDLLQETSVSLWRKWSEFDSQKDFFRWACGVAFIEVLRYRRQSANQRLWFSQELLETLAVEFAKESELLELRSVALGSCLDKLPEQDRRIIEAKYRDGVTMEILAQEFHKPSSTLYKRVARIRDCLYMCIEGTIARHYHP
jgi:RNA polymerase sigma-70 factor, ECF subfamily